MLSNSIIIRVIENYLIFPEPIRLAAEHRLPILKGTQYEPLVNSPDTFTPDGKWILGEAPEVCFTGINITSCSVLVVQLR